MPSPLSTLATSALHTFTTEEDAETAARHALREHWEPDVTQWVSFSLWLKTKERRKTRATLTALYYVEQLWEMHGFVLGSDMQSVRYMVEDACSEHYPNEARCVEVLRLLTFFRTVCYHQLSERHLVLKNLQHYGDTAVQQDEYGTPFTLWCARWDEREGRLLRRYILRLVHRLREKFGIHDYDDHGELIPETPPVDALVSARTEPTIECVVDEEDAEALPTGEAVLKDTAIVLHCAKMSGLVSRSFRFLAQAWELKEDAVSTYGPLKRNKGEGHGGVVYNMPGADAENFAAVLLARFGSTARQHLMRQAERIADAGDDTEAWRAAAPHPDLLPARYRNARRS